MAATILRFFRTALAVSETLSDTLSSLTTTYPPAPALPQTPNAMVLGYEEQIISDLLDDPSGGLVVLSSGLPLHSLISSLLLLHSPSSGTLLLLSASDPQKSLILRSLRRLNPSLSPFSVPGEIPGDLPSHHRSSLYSSGAALFVTPRILIADLLTSRCPPSALAGVLLLNAHRLSDTSTEAFIARILRAGNRSAYVRAFTDRPQAMLSGFAKAERIMKCLFVRKLHLWPRFHVLVSGDLERSPPEVVDVRVPMTAAMKGVQGAVLGAMDACLKELRRTNKVDVDDLTVENGLFKSFDEIVRRQLDPIWHTLGRKTRQLVYDLGTLRKLADYLVRYDAVTYLKYLDTLRASEGVRSIWVFADSSHKVFELSKKRVYKVMHSDGSAITSNIKVIGISKKRAKTESGASLQNTKEKYSSTAMVLEEVLEEAPKWRVLRELLEEIEEERKRTLPTEDGCTTAELGNDSDVVLVACKDERSCMQLEDCIQKGPKQVMQDEWQKYLLGKAELLGLQKRKKQKNQDPKGFGVLNGEVLAGSGENARVTSTNKMENDVLLAVASKISIANGEEVASGCKSELTNVRGGRQKGKGQKGMKSAQVSGKKSKIATVGVNKIGEPILGSEDVKSTSDGPQDIMQVDDAVPFLQKHSDKHGRSGLDEAKPLPPVQFYALDSDQGILYELKPSVIVVYHPNMDFVREIEVYKAENPLMKLRVYFLFYEESTEVQKFEASIRRENAAFESLIRQKSLMMMPVDQDSGYPGSSSSSALHTLVPQNSITRKAGGRKVEDREMQVIVDMREFMSSLPNVLHQKGMRIIPVVLEVGDYVLSPLICVERKSVSDLFQSFSSGRLYHQVETMSRYYQIPVLLIEFSQDKSFSFLSANDIGDDVSSSSIISKLSLLAIHFPRLRLVWSRSVHATAEIFASLKSNQDEPDEVKAVRVGVPSEDGVVENDVRAENYNTTAVEFLRRLPGVTDSNYRALMDGCKSLADLALLPVEDLAELMGGQKAARTLREFLDAKCPTIL